MSELIPVQAVDDDEENDGDNTIFRLIEFNAPRLI